MKKSIGAAIAAIVLISSLIYAQQAISELKKELLSAQARYIHFLDKYGPANKKTCEAYKYYQELKSKYQKYLEKSNIEIRSDNSDRAPQVDNVAVSLIAEEVLESEGVSATKSNLSFFKRLVVTVKSYFSLAKDEELVELARFYVAKGKFEKADRYLRKVKVSDKKILVFKASVCANLGKTNEAFKLIKEAGVSSEKLKDARVAAALFQEGLNFEQQQKLRKALNSFEKASNTYPESKKLQKKVILTKEKIDEINEENFLKVYRECAYPYVEEKVAFKIGGFDTIEQYREKLRKGYRKELHSDEYFEKFVDKRTYRWKSRKAKREFDKIAGIDCGGLCQRVMIALAKKAGIKKPLMPNYKIPGRKVFEKYCNRLEEDGYIPPLSAKPGDFIRLYEHDGWGHIFIFDGRDEYGNVWIVEASGVGYCRRIKMPDRYKARYAGTARYKELDLIRERLKVV